ncbi:hypothetical protein RCO48_38685 [Peribacillus frigoritolerans]|nr:hypothetical protein [Peribacillus frigoritolerans]
MIILEAASVHPSGMLTSKTIAGYDQRIVDAYKELSETLHKYGTKVFSQLFHGGREVVSSDYRNAAWAPSAVPSLRFGVMPKPMSLEDIEGVIEGFAHSAQLAKEGGLDGVEICCSHGYLPAQFWSQHTNKRTDIYGGLFENRMRFIVEILEKVWERVGEDFTVGIRMSSDELTMDGTTMKDSVQIVEYLAEKSPIGFHQCHSRRFKYLRGINTYRAAITDKARIPFTPWIQNQDGGSRTGLCRQSNRRPR